MQKTVITWEISGMLPDCEVTIHNKDQDMQASLKTTN